MTVAAPNNQSAPLAAHYDTLAPQRDFYRNKNKYYYELLHKEYKYFVPEGKRVLEVGCGTGELLNALKPSYGVGVDISPEMIKIAKGKFAHLYFEAGQTSELKTSGTFDYIVISGLLGELDDIQKFFEGIRRFCTKDTRIIIEYYSYFWQSILGVAERLQLKIPQKLQNWITS